MDNIDFYCMAIRPKMLFYVCSQGGDAVPSARVVAATSAAQSAAWVSAPASLSSGGATETMTVVITATRMDAVSLLLFFLSLYTVLSFYFLFVISM